MTFYCRFSTVERNIGEWLILVISRFSFISQAVFKSLKTLLLVICHCVISFSFKIINKLIWLNKY